MQTRSLVVGYPRRPVLPPIDLTLRRGKFLGLVGPNGSGKTTLVRTVLGLLAPLGGDVLFPDGRQPRFGYVPQREGVEPSYPLSALEITQMGRYGSLRLFARPGPDDRRAAAHALAEVGAEALAAEPFYTLSGGQRQRVLIARALAGEPDVLVLDEPTTGMDLPSERAMLDLVASFCRRNLAVVMVSHQLGAVANYANELCLVAGAGRPVIVGTRDEVLTSSRLTELYGQPVTVAEVDHHATIFIPWPVAKREP